MRALLLVVAAVPFLATAGCTVPSGPSSASAIVPDRVGVIDLDDQSFTYVVEWTPSGAPGTQCVAIGGPDVAETCFSKEPK